MAGKHTIREAELREFLTLQEEIKALELQLSTRKKELELAERALADRIAEGCTYTGRLIARIMHTPVQTKPAWKTIAMRYAEQLAFSAGKVLEDARKEAEDRRKHTPPKLNIIIEPKEAAA